MRFFPVPLAALALAACAEAPPPQTDDAEGPADTLAETDQASPAPASAEEDIRRYLLQTYPDAAPMRYALAWSDLDGDGADEAIVYLAAPYFCGSGGCPTLVLTPAGPMWREVANISVSRTPITVMDSATNGWKDITVAVSGGGGEAGNALLKFDGEAYPSNPTVAPAEMTADTGTEVIAEMPDFVELEAASGG
jgi:putative lipoprotein